MCLCKDCDNTDSDLEVEEFQKNIKTNIKYIIKHFICKSAWKLANYQVRNT